MIPAGAAILSFLLVSEIPMFSMKFMKEGTDTYKWERIAFIAVAVVSLAVTLVLGQHFSHAVLFIFLTYIIMNVVGAIFRR